MLEQQSVHEKLEYLVQVTGRQESDVLAEALDQGLAAMYRNQIKSSYLAGNISQEEAVTLLDDEFVQELVYAREAVTQDVKWGLDGD